MNDLRGDFRKLPLPALVSWLRNRQKSGVLRMQSDGVRKEFRFRQGKPFLVRSSLQSEQLESFLAGRGLAELEQLKLLRKASIQSQIAFGDYLVQELPIAKVKLQAIAQELLYLALDEAMQWPSGAFRFSFGLPQAKGKRQEATSPSSGTSVAIPSAESILADEALFMEIGRQIMDGRVEIPPLPDTLLKIQNCLRADDWSAQKLMKIIMADQILTSGILKQANSSLYGLTTRVTSLQHAIVLMGIKEIQGIVTHHVLSGTFTKEQQAIREVLDHSFHCAIVAQRLAGMVGLDEEDAFTCGLLHDIGKTVLLAQLEDYGVPPAARHDLIRRFHTEAGVLLAARWNMSEMVIEAIEYHHEPARTPGALKVVEVVSLADRLVHRLDDDEELRESCCSIIPERIDFALLRELVEDLHP